MITESICYFHVSPSSIIKTRNLTEDTCLMISVFILKDICSFCDLFFSLKCPNFVLDVLMDNLFALSYFTTSSNSVCTIFDKVIMHELELKAFVSSA